MKILGKYSMGLGDRFGHQGSAQLRAIIKAAENGIEITPVWNKSNREHNIIGTTPADVRIEADTTISKAGFKKPYFVDADHVNFESVDRFIASSDFFTIDVASYIGQEAEKEELGNFISESHKYEGSLKIPGADSVLKTPTVHIEEISKNYLYAATKAGDIYKKIEKVKGKGNFITEISMDEVQKPQTPTELFFILKMLANETIPLQTIAPKFSGRFNKGVEYVGNPLEFAAEFESYLRIIDFAVKEFGLPEDLKISIHSGSDKFALYPHIASIASKLNKGVHLKTAGTTWLEEIIGLALSGDNGLNFVKKIYTDSLDNIEELCAPYSDVTDINRSSLPSKKEILKWDSKKFADSLRHIPGNTKYNRNMRQLLHVSYKLAALRIDEYFKLLDENSDIISQCVFENIYTRHICRLFYL